MACRPIFVKFDNVSGGGAGTYDMVDSQNRVVFESVHSSVLEAGATYSIDVAETQVRLTNFRLDGDPGCGAGSTPWISGITSPLNETQIVFDENYATLIGCGSYANFQAVAHNSSTAAPVLGTEVRIQVPGSSPAQYTLPLANKWFLYPSFDTADAYQTDASGIIIDIETGVNPGCYGV